jgi:methylmalonyl-CoA mutase N-terminal domain/subunit
VADGMAYVEATMKAGLDVDAFAPRLSFFFNVHNDFFEEIAKFRAARRVWGKLMRERYGARDPRSWLLRTHAQTAGCALTAQQPYNNVVRVAVQALAAVLGGVQSLHTNALDETLALPTEEAATIALRTQQIIAHETGVTYTIDPVGGSYFVESLTREIEEEVWGYLHKIDDLGGMVRAVEHGFPQKEIVDASYRYQQTVEAGEEVVVGVNRFVAGAEEPLPLLRIDPERIAEQQVERMHRLKGRRDNGGVQKALDGLRRAAEGEDPWGQDLLMPRILEAVRAYATLGEIMGVFREAWGEYIEPAVL